jgi:ABC-type glycerol-3-phosphate transport system substrate-binding protein
MKKRMAAWFALLLSMIMVFSACSGNSGEGNDAAPKDANGITTLSVFAGQRADVENLETNMWNKN